MYQVHLRKTGANFNGCLLENDWEKISFDHYSVGLSSTYTPFKYKVEGIRRDCLIIYVSELCVVSE